MLTVAESKSYLVSQVLKENSLPALNLLRTKAASCIVNIN